MRLRTVFLVFLGLVAGLAAVVVYGASHWQAGTRALRGRLEAARQPIAPTTYDPSELEGLPAPVQRYFRAALTEGQPMVASAQVHHEGVFYLEAQDRWAPFASDQLVITQRPGFDWDARIRMAPGVRVFAHDAYVAGEGILHVSVLGLVPVADLRGTPEVAQGELLRFFAEAAWYPTALLPSQGVRWEPLDDDSARATRTDGDVTVSLTFHFGDEGLIRTVRAEERYRAVGEEQVPTPWEGRFGNYALRDGMRVPLEGEVAWLLPEGRLPYWRGRIVDIAYAFVE